MAPRIFSDRQTAGRDLGEHLVRVALDGEIIVLGLPRGGVPVACEVAARLGAPVDVLVVRKLGAPFDPELALGAIAFGEVVVYNDDLLAAVGRTREQLAPTLEHELTELRRRESAYRQSVAPPAIAGKTVVIVDDGMATGATMHAAVVATRALSPRRIVVAVPTASREAVERLAGVADRVIALEQPEPYFGVGAWYGHFEQVSDAEVVAALADARRHGDTAVGRSKRGGPTTA